MNLRGLAEDALEFTDCRCGARIQLTWQKRAMREPLCWPCVERERGEMAIMMLKLAERKKAMGVRG